jgi:hypothetical protein
LMGFHDAGRDQEIALDHAPVQAHRDRRRKRGGRRVLGGERAQIPVLIPRGALRVLDPTRFGQRTELLRPLAECRCMPSAMSTVMSS